MWQKILRQADLYNRSFKRAFSCLFFEVFLPPPSNPFSFCPTACVSGQDRALYPAQNCLSETREDFSVPLTVFFPFLLLRLLEQEALICVEGIFQMSEKGLQIGKKIRPHFELNGL